MSISPKVRGLRPLLDPPNLDRSRGQGRKLNHHIPLSCPSVLGLSTTDTDKLSNINNGLIQCIIDSIGIAGRSGIASDFFIKKASTCMDKSDVFGAFLDDLVEARPNRGPSQGG